jgi:endonuclease III
MVKKAIANFEAADIAMKRKKSRRLTPVQVQEIFSRFAAKAPAPQGELHSVNDFTLLVAVVLSAQATDVGVNKATKALFEKADTPEKMLALGGEGLAAHIKTIGLYQTKAKNILLLCERLIAHFHSTVPQTREELESLAGVGRKTANVVLNMAFGQKTIAVDTHLFRVANRTGLAQGKTPLAVENGLLKIIPDEFLFHAHHWLILHGRYICKAQKPTCTGCLIKDLCLFEAKT